MSIPGLLLTQVPSLPLGTILPPSQNPDTAPLLSTPPERKDIPRLGSVKLETLVKGIDLRPLTAQVQKQGFLRILVIDDRKIPGKWYHGEEAVMKTTLRSLPESMRDKVKIEVIPGIDYARNFNTAELQKVNQRVMRGEVQLIVSSADTALSPTLAMINRWTGGNYTSWKQVTKEVKAQALEGLRRENPSLAQDIDLFSQWGQKLPVVVAEGNPEKEKPNPDDSPIQLLALGNVITVGAAPKARPSPAIPSGFLDYVEHDEHSRTSYSSSIVAGRVAELLIRKAQASHPDISWKPQSNKI